MDNLFISIFIFLIAFIIKLQWESKKQKKAFNEFKKETMEMLNIINETQTIVIKTLKEVIKKEKFDQ